jgi:hypothetical protein
MGAHAENPRQDQRFSHADELNLCSCQLLPGCSMHSIEWENPQGYGVGSPPEWSSRELLCRSCIRNGEIVHPLGRQLIPESRRCPKPVPLFLNRFSAATLPAPLGESH